MAVVLLRARRRNQKLEFHSDRLLAKGFALDIPAGYGSEEPEGRMRDGQLNRMGLPTQREQNSRYGPYNGN